MHDFPVCFFNPPFRGCQNPINGLCVWQFNNGFYHCSRNQSNADYQVSYIKNRKHRVFGCVYRCGYWGVCTCLASMNDCWVEYWASAHRGKLGQLTPGKMDENLKSENMQKRAVFYVYVIFWEQSGQAGVENGAMLTTYLFRNTSEAPFRSQIFKIFFASGGKGAVTP